MSELPEVINKNDGSKIFRYKKNDELHRVGNPAVIEINNKDNVVLIEYWQNGKMYREPNEGPISMMFYPDGKIKSIRYNNIGLVYIKWNINGNIASKIYKISKSKLLDKLFDTSGDLIKEIYLKRQSDEYYVPHRKYDPAIIIYDKNKNIIKREYWMNGMEYDVLV